MPPCYQQPIGRPSGWLVWVETVVQQCFRPVVAKVDAGKGGTKFELSFTVRPKADRSVLGVRLNLSGRPFFGPLGSGVARATKADLQQSLRLFAELYG